MEFRGQLIMNLLRILTPEEIADLTTSFSGKKKVDLSTLLESDLAGKDFEAVMDELQENEEKDEEDSGEGAKILAFDSKEEERSEDVVESFQAGQRVHLLMQEYTKAFQKMDKNVLGPKRFPKIKGSGQRKQTSTMILEQKKKLYESYYKIKSKEVLSLYAHSSKADIQKKKEGEKEDYSFSSQLGILVNKRQA